MTVRTYRKDPRSRAERVADARVLAAFEAGEILRVPQAVEDAAIERLRQIGNPPAARLGAVMRTVRRRAGLTQSQLARAVGMQRSSISRLERGRAPSVTFERFLAILEAVERLAAAGERPARSAATRRSGASVGARRRGA